MNEDGNGTSHIVAAFLLQHEDSESLQKMVQLFKDRNPDWTKIEVVITDKDMGERNVFKEEMPQIDLQICLFHALRTFSRELTIDKMGITAGERTTLLQITEELAYAHSETYYNTKYQEFCEICPNDRVKSYYNNNWHNIRSEWVQGLKSTQFNLGENTNNRLESYFAKLKDIVTHKVPIRDFIIQFMKSLTSQRNIIRDKAIKATTRVRAQPLQCEVECEFDRLLTKFSFLKVQKQLELIPKVTVLSNTSVKTSKGVIMVTKDSCECAFYTSNRLPCRHIFAIRKYNNEPLYCPEVCDKRWTCIYTYSHMPQRINQSTPVRVSIIKTPIRKVLCRDDKYKKALFEAQKFASTIANLGIEQFNSCLDKMKQFNNLIASGTDFQFVEFMNLSAIEHCHTTRSCPCFKESFWFVSCPRS